MVVEVPLWLTRAQLRRIAPFFPLSHGVPQVDDRRVVSGIPHVIRNGLRWRDAPEAYGPHKTLYDRFRALEPARHLQLHLLGAGRLGGRAGPADDRRHAPEGASHRRQPSSKGAEWARGHGLRSRLGWHTKGLSRHLGRTKGGLNSKLHAVCDGQGRPVVLLLSAGQMSDHKGARLMLDALPAASTLVADPGYDSRMFREALAAKGIEPCIPSSKPERCLTPTTRRSIVSATKSKTCSAASRIGGASPPATTDAPTPS